MGNSSSTPVRDQDAIEEDDEDDILTEAAFARRAEDIRSRFPIESPVDEAIPCEYTAFISPDSPPLLTTLPPELIEELVSYLDNRSIKNLRLTCRLFCTIKLRINRVFLSANPLNIRVVHSIADHDVYRQEIIELIYDDARLCHSRADHSNNQHPDTVRPIPLEILYDRPMTDMEWFQTERDANLEELQSRERHDESGHPTDLRIYRQANAELPLAESWSYYHDLLHQQDDVIAHGADVQAFRYALQRFPALRTVTVTPAAHGWLFTPLYETPMIRAFPYGFNYPLPRGWPTERCYDTGEEPAPWEDSKARWRGYCLVVKVLAQERQHHRVSELRIDSHNLRNGLNCRIFEQPSEEYLDFVSCLQHPNLKKLHLSLMVEFSWTAFRRNLLRNALAKSSQLEYFSLETGMDIFSYAPMYYSHHEIPPALQTFLPVDRWTRLQYFRLWNIPVDSADLILTLLQLPALQLLELGFLFLQSGTQRELLEEMRDSLLWHERNTRPKVKFAVPIDHYIQGRAIWIDEEVENFLYHGGENPLEINDEVCYDMGVMRDAFDPEFERPYIHPKKRLELLRALKL
ncbi:uncharacterized protein TrAFT101_002148 [Trichoderma asperellum]|uniref:F-box domain-containing protein n=1 Tax=Trichoderma asperellum (strain ATCC 204424 / CBS 433.97 / NBRC 101777) TaxID=1042311 RepID=A0A2T3ZFL6_TRIA4|nr:hypothetical protein M441DRAFT_455599 [Trichoderma asperellum CBS 433.97]PTB43589.1 hypothetical protein M441DRAFT_455599 [Trichoderma asperellum CBS 433.97]UKZ86312.1 hypothetical protein TrAFT101_002148 [Trichoderma asperellum]